MSHPLLLGHRGARATRSVPENTVASFDLALAHSCDGFEFDVRQTADGRAVICHDPTIHGVEVAHAGAGELQELPLLGQVLARYAQSAFLDIEIKAMGLEGTVLTALQSHPPQQGYVLSSFLPDVLLALRALDPGVPLGLICEDSSQLASWRGLPVQFVIPHYSLVDEDLCRVLRAGQKQILVWTVNRREEMLRLKGWGVDGIISDDTKLLVDVLASAKSNAAQRPDTRHLRPKT
jgi:glycerophosphoryl diester phosphodiesterase